MDLKGIISIPGKPGLYKVVSQVKSATIVESLADQKKFPIYVSDQGVQLDRMSIITNDKDKEVPVPEVMDIIYKKESGGPCPDPKSDEKTLRAYFAEIVPDYDREQVYISVIRKVFTWYNSLHSLNLLKMEEKAEEKQPDEKTEENKTEESN